MDLHSVYTNPNRDKRVLAGNLAREAKANSNEALKFAGLSLKVSESLSVGVISRKDHTEMFSIASEGFARRAKENYLDVALDVVKDDIHDPVLHRLEDSCFASLQIADHAAAFSTTIRLSIHDPERRQSL
jgi:hypothetical protein